MRVLLVGFSGHRGWDGARRWLATTTPDRAGRGFPIECLFGHRPAAVSLDRGVAAPTHNCAPPHPPCHRTSGRQAHVRRYRHSQDTLAVSCVDAAGRRLRSAPSPSTLPTRCVPLLTNSQTFGGSTTLSGVGPVHAA